MWLFTPDGFYSAVQHKDDPDKIMVRTRAKMHAERLVQALPEGERPPVQETPPPADYRWRVTLTREQWIYLAAKFAAEIAYLNFKNEAHKREHPTGFMTTLHRVWGDLLGFQDDQHADTRKGRWGQSQSHASHHSTLKSDAFDDLDDWLGRAHRRPDPEDEDDYEWIDDDLVEESRLEPGMPVRLLDDDDDAEFGIGVVKSISLDGVTVVVGFTQVLEDGTEEEDVLELRVDELAALVNRDVAEEMAEELCTASRPSPEEYDDPDTLAEEDDGSWPPPVLRGFLRGR